MTISSIRIASSLSALAVAGALAATQAQPAAAQTATRLNCDGCINSRHIGDGSIKARDLAPGLLFGRTVLIRANGGSAAANCDNLRDALAAIRDASVDNPVLVRLARGTYNCGATPLAMKPFVTIEGAGRSFSKITGRAVGSDQGVVTGANQSALRHLTVEHTANGSGVAIAVNTGKRGMSLSDVAIKLSSATVNEGYGILAAGGALELTNVSVQTSASAGQSQGIRGVSGATLNLRNVWVHNQSGAVGNPAALELRDSSVTGFGVLFSSNVFGLLGRGNSVFELVDGTVIGGRGTGAFTGSFTCVGIAKEDFTARAADCL